MVLPLMFLVHLTLFVFVESLTQVPFATLYSGKYCDSDSITTEGMYESSLRTIGWDEKAHSVKMLGTWIFYERESFNSFEEGQTIHFIGDNDICINSTTLQLAGQISSIRYAGLPWSYKDDAINIYEVEDFQGDEIKSEKDLPFVASQFQASLIITGCSAWTFYDRPSYHGKPVCINATEDGQPVLTSISGELKENKVLEPMCILRQIKISSLFHFCTRSKTGVCE
ncbi:unnamed protein product [Allacma fusca]|uniref:Beta/gamma crystallin 'Greek key' domain-containing protein n=1 Tax=Allacma fusca TaxID=39272 RepID=A0A8J2NPE4_9HEXA|nr:unnamed protein product [Allacma fusca]